MIQVRNVTKRPKDLDILKAYSKDLKALVFLKEQAASEFWDKHWGGEDYYQHLSRYKNLRFIRHYTKKYGNYSATKTLRHEKGLTQFE